MKSLLSLLLLAPLIIRGSGPISTPTSSPQSRDPEGRLRRVNDGENNPSQSPTPALTLEQRIQEQTAIEKIFYDKRIWPKENKSPKPLFETMVPKELIEKKVNESLLKSAALEKYWGRAVTPAMLQAELDRMAKGTQDAQTLHDLFEALGNDPRLIAETLARETLSDRLVRSWYAWDTRFHADARARAEAVAARVSPVGATLGSPAGGASPAPTRLGAESHHHTYILDERGEQTPPIPGVEPDTTRVKGEEFAALRKKWSPLLTSPPSRSAGGEVAPSGAGEGAARYPLADQLGSTLVNGHPLTLPSPPVAAAKGGEGMIHPLETAEGFVLQQTLSLTDTHIEIETILIRKKTFDEWWAGVVPALSDPTSHPAPRTSHSFSFRLPAIAAVAGCDQWEKAPGLNNVPPNGRGGHAAIWTGSEMIVWGGSYNASVVNTGGRYNPSTDSWYPTSGGANLLSPRQYHSAVWTGTEMIVWGGQDSSTGFNDGSRYNPNTDMWTPTSMGVNTPAIRASHSALWTGSLMIIWGGGPNTGGRYAPATDSWLPTSTGANVPSARFGQGAVWTGSEMIVWGGEIYTCTPTCGYVYYNDGGRYSPASDTWQPLALLNAPAARGFHSSVWTGAEMIVWGAGVYVCSPSCNFVHYNTGGRYNPASNTWTATSIGANAPSPRTGMTSAWSGSEMIVWGGQGPGSTNMNDGGRYNPVTDLWTLTSTAINVPANRSGHSAAWTGSEMIVWGGYPIGLNTGGRYNPVTDNWIPTSTGANVPSARDSQVSVWTGSEMIVWGGYDGSYLVNSGGRYNLATDSWTPTSLAMNVPEARGGHTVVWSGNEMMIWGGYGYSGRINAGGRYNPASDSWISIAVDANTPTARAAHSAVWSGAEMVIWGGSAGNSVWLNSGGRYDFFSDQWRQTSLINAPIPRANASAIWTGNEMIVWGGSSGSGSFHNTGGKYLPGPNTWTPTTLISAPSARAFQSATWSDDKMVVFGGHIGVNTPTNTGGQYNPMQDTWTSTSLAVNVPSARELSSTVWTGAEMIIWSGTTTTNYPDSFGARYFPFSDTWKTLSAGSYTPGARVFSPAVWTGSKMIIWGGSSGLSVSYYRDGGIYSSGAAASPANSIRGKKTSAISFNWMSVFGAGSYNVKRCNPTATGCIPGTIVSTPTINQYSESDDGLSHFYAVEAVNQCDATQ